ncbi:MAG: vWA domain-containing protein [Planctomycetota bacterium]
MLRFPTGPRPTRTSHRPRRGAIVPLVCLLLPVLIVLAAFSINFAHMELVRTQAQVAADASVRAAGRTFTLTGSLDAARTAARNVATRTPIGTQTLPLPDSSFVLGSSTRAFTSTRFSFTPTDPKNPAIKPNAMRVSVNQDNFQHLFSGIDGMQNFAYNRTAVSTQVEVDIVLVLDRSGSMAYAADEKAVAIAYPKAAPPGWVFGMAAPPKSRWLDLVNASDAFLNYLDQSFVAESVGLVTYGDTATMDRSVSPTYSTIRAGIDKYTKNYPVGATNISDGIAKGTTILNSGRAFASKIMVLMTDGIRTAGVNPVPSATTLGGQGVIIYTVTFSAEADQATMKSIAAAGNGMHFHAPTGAALQSAFETIARSIPTIITE